MNKLIKKIEKKIIKDGILIVDDVDESNSWDGANQAFNEFVNENSLKFKLVGKKCGVIEF